MRTWKDVATLAKTRSLNGRFVARVAADLPCVFREGMEVALVPPQTDCPRAGTIDYVRELSDGSVEIGIDTVTDDTAAHALVGCHCLVRLSDIADALEDERALSWDGWRVVSPTGAEIGVVAGMSHNSAQSLLEVDRGEGMPLSYIPVVDAFIVEVDEEERVVTVDIPDDLLTLND